ncbi:MAG: BMP family ABC transporter substrate-binding protein [Thermomicrobiales bacterium]
MGFSAVETVPGNIVQVMDRRFGRRAFTLSATAAAAAVAAGALGVDAFAQGADATPGASPVASPIASGEGFKVAFIYVGPVGDLGWTYAHDEGRKYLEQVFPGIEASYSESVPETGADAERVIRDYAQKGYNLIVATSFGFMDATVNVAKQFPDTQFIHISGYKTAENLSTAFGKIEEPRYVSGQLAAGFAPSGKLGYVAAFPIPEVIRGINAFTLGVRKINPEATVQVVWTNTWYDPQKERQAAEALLDGGAEVIAQHQDTAGPQQAAEAAGKYGVGYNADMAPLAPKAVITCPIWHWGVYYAEAVKGIMDGTWTSNAYWGGWKDGLVDLSPIADFVEATEKEHAVAEEKSFQAGEQDIFTIFTGPLKAQDGSEKVADGTAMTGEELLAMNWFVEGVQGELPS